MADFIYSIILLILALIAIELRKSYRQVPKVELRRRAASGDILAKKVYRAVAYGDSLEILLWLIIIFCLAGALALFNVIAPLWLGFIVVAIFTWLAIAWLPKLAINSLGDKLALYLTPGLVFILNYLHPVFSKVGNLLNQTVSPSHTGLYERKDLLNLVSKQRKQVDSRISPDDLVLIKRGLKLTNKTVGQYCKLWSKLHHVLAHDAIGPILLDELHKTDQPFVPVIADSESKKVVGMIDTSSLDLTNSGQIKDIMDENIYYLNEDDSLSEALRAMANTTHSVFMVLDKKQRLLGMITLRDVLAELINLGTKTKDYTLNQSE